MLKKIVDFLEAHAEKVVISIVILLCLWLLLTRVLLSPYKVEFDNKKLGFGEIDNYVLEKHGRELESRIQEPGENKEEYQNQYGVFLSKLDSSFSTIETNLSFPLPAYSTTSGFSDRRYAVPEIPEIENLDIEHIRGAAYIPTEQVTREISYSDVKKDANDLDLVTVQGTIDLAVLREHFAETYAGPMVKAEWRDEKLGKPVFAAVQLERQRELPDGSWSEWEVISKTKVNPLADFLRIPEEASELKEGGIRVLMIQFDNPHIQKNVVQPPSYFFASADEKWLPPEFHKRYTKILEDIQVIERRVKLEEEKALRDEDRLRQSDVRRQEMESTRGSSSTGSSDGRPSAEGGRDSGRPTAANVLGREAPARITEREPKKDVTEQDKVTDLIKELQELQDEFMEVVLVPSDKKEDKEDNEKKDVLVFWAHDDRVEPEKTYRYRTRLGVFNPVAGTEQFSEGYESYRDEVVLWSDYSSITGPVYIPAMTYFFPVDALADGRTSTVQVSRYHMGYWYSKDFVVKSGEMIGGIATVENEVPSGINANELASSTDKEKQKSEIIDFGTDCLMVDMRAVTDWSDWRTLRARKYWEMLYTYDGDEILSRPIKMMNWPDWLKGEFGKIKETERIAKKPLQEFDELGGGAVLPSDFGGGGRGMPTRGGSNLPSRGMPTMGGMK